MWAEGSWRVPAIYLNDWPDRYIHTNADGVANIDATKLLRAAFLGAANAWYLANLDGAGMPALWEVVRRGSLERTGEALARRDRLRAMGEATEGDNLMRFHFEYETGVVASMGRFGEMPSLVQKEAERFLAGLREIAGVVPAPGSAGIVYRRSPEPKGPMGGFGYDYFQDHFQDHFQDQTAQRGIAAPALLRRNGLWGGGYDYEALNLVDGRRTVGQIRDALAAIYGPVPLAEVAEYLQALEKIGILRAGSGPP